jgi:hypothetical protein
MIFGWFKALFDRRPELNSGNDGRKDVDVTTGVLGLQDKIYCLKKFQQTCDQAGLGVDYENAVSSVNAFAAKCLALSHSRCRSAEVLQGIIAMQKEATSNLMSLALSANARGINLQAEVRQIYETLTDITRACRESAS